MADRFARIPSRAVGCRELTARDWRVLIAIASHANGDGLAWPGFSRIAELAAIDRTKVPPSVKKLSAAGLVRATRRRDEAGDAASTVYEILFDEPGVLPFRGTPVAADGNTVLPPVGTGGVPTGGTLIDQYQNRLPNKRSARREPRADVSMI
jgi:hypothetical protein